MAFTVLASAAHAATVATATIDGARVVEAVLPGRVLGTAPTADGRLAILAAPEDGPRTVFLLDPSGEGAIDPAVTDLPPATDALGRLGGEVVAGEPGIVYSLGPGGGSAPRTILEAVHLHPRPLERRGLITANSIFQPLAGKLRIFGPGVRPPGEGGGLALRRELALPAQVRREPAGLRLETPEISLLSRPDAGPRILVGPVAHGRRRLLTTVIDSATSAVLERWSELPAPETVGESVYLSVDGRPTLAVTALSAEKLGIFERQKLRVFPLWADRTRAGSPPTLTAETTSRRWQKVGVGVVDLDRDGRDDLAVVQRDGLGGKKLVVEVYPGKGNGGFLSTPRRTVVTAPEAGWRYGADVTGDGVPDLVASTRGLLLVFPGVEHKKLVVAKKARWAFEPAALPAAGAATVTVTLTVSAAGGEVDEGSEDEPDFDDGEDEPQLVDLGDDGKYEILVVSEAEGRSILRLIEL